MHRRESHDSSQATLASGAMEIGAGFGVAGAATAYYYHHTPGGAKLPFPKPPLQTVVAGLSLIGAAGMIGYNLLWRSPRREFVDSPSERAVQVTADHGRLPPRSLIFLVPILVAPLAHNLVTLATRYPRLQRPLLMGAVGATVGAVSQRLYLMSLVGIGAEKGLGVRVERKEPLPTDLEEQQ